jgi:hypothetical protein
MANYAIIVMGTVENVIVWDSTAAYTPPSGSTAIEIPSGQTVGIGYTYTNGVFTAPAVPTPTPLTLAQQAQAALDAGLTITSTSTPSLNGTYNVNQTAQENIDSTELYVDTNGEFPEGATEMPWELFGGAGAVVFPSTAEFKAFATAVADYVAALQMVIDSNSGTLPVNAVTIA